MYAEHERHRATARNALKAATVAQIEATIASGGNVADGYLIAVAVTDFERDRMNDMLNEVRTDYAERYPEDDVEALNAEKASAG